jgi:hypothetical protein
MAGDRLAILVAIRRFPGVGVADSQSLRSESYICMQHFVRRITFVPFRRLRGMCNENSCNVFLVLFMVVFLSPLRFA